MQLGEISQHRQRMESLEAAIRNELEAVQLEVRHHFAYGTYTRELFIPKGTILTGHIHRHSCVNIISKGKIRAISDEGEYDIEAPHTFISGPFVKKAGYALEDTVWINVHPWFGEPDLELIEKEMIIPSYAALENEVATWLGQ
jgi:hypothetical protein